MDRKQRDASPAIDFKGWDATKGRGLAEVQTYDDDDGDLMAEHTILVRVDARSVDGDPRDDPKDLERWAMAAARGVAGCFPQDPNPDTLESQVGRLAAFITGRVPGEPSQSEGAVDTAIRILGRHYPDPGANQRTTVEALTAIAVRWAFELSHDSWPEKLQEFGPRLRTALGLKLEKRLSEPFAFNPPALELVIRETMLPIAESLGWFEGDAAEAIDAAELVQKVLRSAVLESI